MEDFANRVNADLVNKAANLASRCVKFVNSRLGGRSGPPRPTRRRCSSGRRRGSARRGAVPRVRVGRALRAAIEIAEDFNLYVTEAAPWKLATPTRSERGRCAGGGRASKIIAAILAPVLPAWAEKTERVC
jgi:methionyl-tRNA synthetase